jgi:hypothetical protein
MQKIKKHVFFQKVVLIRISSLLGLVGVMVSLTMSQTIKHTILPSLVEIDIFHFFTDVPFKLFFCSVPLNFVANQILPLTLGLAIQGDPNAKLNLRAPKWKTK